MSDLTEKQRIFVAEYLKEKNATKAAIAAGYSEKTAEQQGSRLLSSVKVKEALGVQLEAQEKRTLITADRILLELFRVATTDVLGAFNDDGTVKKLSEMPEEIRRAISYIEVDEIWQGFGEDRIQIGVTKKIKLWEKTKGLELLGKNLKLWVERLEVSGLDELAERVKRGRERANGSKPS